jgi:hypothetical protein
LRGVDYPATRDELIDHVQSEWQRVIDALVVT